MLGKRFLLSGGACPLSLVGGSSSGSRNAHLLVSGKIMEIANRYRALPVPYPGADSRPKQAEQAQNVDQVCVGGRRTWPFPSVQFDLE